tara:strand:- start:1825 stop:2040 length:216 start_codon:yes stop_codon:yes gene_type:complete
MRIKEQTVYDLDTEQFKYLQREKNSHLHKVDINELNKRLNKTRKSNFYTTFLITIACLFSLVILSLISIKF